MPRTEASVTINCAIDDAFALSMSQRYVRMRGVRLLLSLGAPGRSTRFAETAVLAGQRE